MKIKIVIILFLMSVCCSLKGQSRDLFIMPGSDFDRPGLHTRVNLNVGMGISLQKLQRVPIGNELTFSYTYENNGSHGFWHTQYGTHTNAIGIMKNFSIPGTKSFGGYTWEQAGISSYTGTPKAVQNRLYESDALGITYHFNKNSGIWFQEQYNKIATVPWYTTTSAGYVISF